MDEIWRKETHQRIESLVTHICAASGCTAEIKIVTCYPCLINDESVITKCRKRATEYLGEDKVHELPQRMAAEDFAYYSQKAPAGFYRLGTGWGDPKKDFPVHSNHFDINEKALETGMGLLAFITLSEMAAGEKQDLMI